MPKSELYGFVPEKDFVHLIRQNYGEITKALQCLSTVMLTSSRIRVQQHLFLYCGGCGRTYNPKIEAPGKRIMSLEDTPKDFSLNS